MGEIKFRQRNVNNGQFHIWGMDGGIWRNPLWQDNFVHPNESDQYTGLKDSKGVEIYKGDVVKTKHPDEIQYFIGKIVWENELSLYGFEFECDAYKSITQLNEFDDIEIIGNRIGERSEDGHKQRIHRDVPKGG